ncbi:MAG: outer membrane beta-barrel protein [Bacteroidetes bacterium]|nr:outer membrane beta-barrel protein [Bacteroidota bacterium]
MLAISSFSFGQKFGFCAGTAYNTMVKKPNQWFPVSYSYYNRFSPYVGFVFRDSLCRFVLLKASVYYVQRGIRYNYKLEYPGVYMIHSDQIFTPHYLSFPVKLNFNYKSFYIGFGLEGSILITGRTKVTTKEFSGLAGNYYETSFDNWDKKVFYAVDAGYNFNLGYKIKQFEIDFNIFHGLQPPPKFFVFASPNFEFQYLYQQTFMLGLNYYPQFKKRNKS